MLIKDYTYTIGKYLPADLRNDIALEVETTIYEQLISEYGETEFTDAQIEKVIYAMGSPKKVAEAYMGKPYTLISSPLIPIYWLVIKFTLLAISVILIITGTIEATQYQITDYLKTAIQMFANIWNAGLSSFGMITIIFMLISKKLNTNEEEENNWSIKSLSKYTPESHRIKIVKSISTIVFTTLGLIWLNYSNLGVYYSISGDAGFIHILNSQMFERTLFFINIIGGLNILLHLYLLVKNEWQLLTRAVDIFITLAGLAVFSYIVFRPGFIDYSILNNAPHFERLKTTLQLTLNISVLVIAILSGLDIWRHVKALFFFPKEVEELNQQLNK